MKKSPNIRTHHNLSMDADWLDERFVIMRARMAEWSCDGRARHKKTLRVSILGRRTHMFAQRDVCMPVHPNTGALQGRDGESCKENINKSASIGFRGGGTIMDK